MSERARGFSGVLDTDIMQCNKNVRRGSASPTVVCTTLYTMC